MATTTPTHTSYAVLGLLAIRSWTAYELARQTERSLRWFFPRAERAVYLEVKRLVVLGWADATTAATGRRTSTVYSITEPGRAALHEWLGESSRPIEIVSEGALKLFFADHGTTAQVRATAEGLGDEANATLNTLASVVGTGSRFPERMNTNVLSMRLMVEIHRTVREWSEWAAGAVDVLESGDAAAIEAQTRAVLTDVASEVRDDVSGRRDAAP